MMMDPKLKGTKTEANLWTAFAGESQARNKYSYFASKAKKDGYVQISKIFEETANNEKEHAKIWFKLLGGIVFSRDGDMIWECGNCGHIHIGQKAPEVCPVCDHPQAYFQLEQNNF